MLDFLSGFDSISSNKGKTDTIAAVRIAGRRNSWIGKDDRDLPVVILECATTTKLPSPVVLRNLRFDPSISCQIVEHPSRKRRKLVAAVLRLTTDEIALQTYFLRTVSALFDELAEDATLLEFAQAIDRLAEIFRSLALPPASSLQGLWAELLLVKHARNVEYAVRSWHPTRRSLFDFDAGAEAVEVKSSTTGIRKHHFKLSQLRPPASKRIYVVSLLLTPDLGGASIPELWAYVQEKLASQPQLLSRAAEIIAVSAGTDWKHAQDARFDERAALQSLIVYDAAHIPQVVDPENPDITDIEFTCDISSTEPLTRSSDSPFGPALTSILPRAYR